MVQFTKQAKSNQDHLQTWQDRGLIIPDLARADRYLSFIGYYRLSAYTIPFQQIVTTPSTVLHQFKANMGMPELWYQDPFWQHALQQNEE